ncbi:MAG TPA: peptide-methionine (R)-S-oxide reductase MsrB [Salinarimonas sp.]|nr:peptide-methionine (R)-S-oxide reductase MsrB [Salinarimonas sp.]
MTSRRTFLMAGISAGAALLTGTARPSRGQAAPRAAFPVTRTEAEWKRLLTPAQYSVLRRAGTEQPGSSPLDREKRSGQFHCIGCDQLLYSSSTKFDSGTGWPSFYAALDGAIGTKTDRKLLIARTEVHCARCGGHLGHVFDDGPPPTGKRHCLNGVALRFAPAA